MVKKNKVFMPAGYSKTPLVKKLGIKPGFKARLIHAPKNYLDLIHPVPEEIIWIEDDSVTVDFIHFFAVKADELEMFIEELEKQIFPNGMLWISWYKKSSKIPTDLTEDVIRHIILPRGLVDVKVCAVDERWSGLKLMWRRELRNKT